MTRPALLEQRRPQKPVQNLKKGQSVNTLTQPTDSDSLAARIAKVREAIEEAETWYDGGLTPEPWAA